MIIRIVPSEPPTTPYTSNDESVKPAIYSACASGLPTICSILRRHPRAASRADVPDDVFASRTFLQQLMALLITSEARDLFQKGERVRQDALADALLACSGRDGGTLGPCGEALADGAGCRRDVGIGSHAHRV